MSDYCVALTQGEPPWYRGGPCSRKAVRDGYCNIHHPEKVKAGFDPARIAALIPPPEECRVLSEMSEEIIYPARKLAAWTRLSERRVKEILRSFASRGWAYYGVGYDEDEYRVCGSGYTLTDAGSVARNIIDDYAVAAIATEAGTAETPESGSVHEGAARKASPNPSRETQP